MMNVSHKSFIAIYNCTHVIFKRKNFEQIRLDLIRVPTSSGNHGKSGKNTKINSMHGKIMQFEKNLNNHGKIMEFCEII